MLCIQLSILSYSHNDIAKQNKTIQKKELFSPEFETWWLKKTTIFNHQWNEWILLLFIVSSPCQRSSELLVWLNVVSCNFLFHILIFNCKTAQPNGDDHWEQKIQNFTNVVDPPYRGASRRHEKGKLCKFKKKIYVSL